MKLNPNMRSETNESVQTSGLHEFSVGLGFTNNLCTIYPNVIRSININCNVTVSKNTANNCDVTCSMKKNGLGISIGLQPNENSFLLRGVARRISPKPGLEGDQNAALLVLSHFNA